MFMLMFFIALGIYSNYEISFSFMFFFLFLRIGLGRGGTPFSVFSGGYPGINIGLSIEIYRPLLQVGHDKNS